MQRTVSKVQQRYAQCLTLCPGGTVQEEKGGGGGITDARLCHVRLKTALAPIS